MATVSIPVYPCRHSKVLRISTARAPLTHCAERYFLCPFLKALRSLYRTFATTRNSDRGLRKSESVDAKRPQTPETR